VNKGSNSSVSEEEIKDCCPFSEQGIILIND
jgi:hypothetical protein